MRHLRSSEITIRPCVAADISAVREIYALHVLHGLASFELEPPNEEEMRGRWRDVVARGFPYLIAEREREVIGYAYASPYRLRPAYRYTAENSVYVREACARQGIGRLLMVALLPQCEALGLRQMVAVIGDSANVASIRLHESLGFVNVGTIRSAGYKLGRWVDTVLMQRALGAGDSTPP